MDTRLGLPGKVDHDLQYDHPPNWDGGPLSQCSLLLLLLPGSRSGVWCVEGARLLDPAGMSCLPASQADMPPVSLQSGETLVATLPPQLWPYPSC